MSDNKYIIDKDSLTGIADAVRDKLGTGEATTDSQTGDIVYPEGKGYYLKQIIIAKWEKSEFTDTWDGTGTSYVTRASVTEEQLLRVCNGVRPVYVKIDVSTNDSILVENSLTNWSSSNHIVTLPTSGRFYCQYAYYHQSYYSGRYFQKTIPAVTFSFLDENQKIIIPENASKIVDESYNRNLLQESVEMPIPFSIDDIQNKIANYLGKPSSKKEKLFITRYSSSTTQANYSDYSNYLWVTSSYNYNVGPTDPTYITTKIPNLRPENILYMAVICNNNNEKNYQFRPENEPMEHYTALTQSGSGKRLATATDYYFFPNGSEIKTSTNKYGILAHWDANNAILDFQGVNKSSGTINGTITASSSAYLKPYLLYIVYEEATE